MYDCIIIGGGIIGCGLLRALTKYNIKVCLLEAEDDIATGASRANSGINHAGFDATPNTLKAKFNVIGNKINKDLCSELGVPYLDCGSLVVGRKNELEALKKLKYKGDLNGVETKILTKKEILAIEPNVAEDIEYALYAPNAGVMSPYRLTINLAEHGVINGGEVFLNNQVVTIKKLSSGFCVSTKTQIDYYSKIVINCSGSEANKINSMINAEQYNIKFRRGEYILLDKSEGKNINTVIFPLPNEYGKGILAAPTADGNVIYGPTAIDQDETLAKVSYKGLQEIKSKILSTYKKVNFKKIIRLYSGVRTIIEDDFIIGISKMVEDFYVICGICSPGLTAGYAISEYVAKQIAEKYDYKAKNNYLPYVIKKQFAKMDKQEIAKEIALNSKFGNIVCRCECVSEAEIINSINSPIPAITLDAIKRRTRAGMGRCQGGFCSVKIMEIISREANLKMTEIKKGGDNSYIALCRIKEV